MKRNIIIVISFLLIVFLGYYAYWKYRVLHAVKIVKLSTSEVEVFSNVKVGDIIQTINGKLITNPKIDTTKIGVHEVSFQYQTDEGIKVSYTIHINVVDKTAPFIAYPGVYRVEVGSTTKEELEKSFFCGDNYDDNPICRIDGDFDLESEGEYPVSWVGIDSSNNVSKHPFTIIVKKRESSSNHSDSSDEEVSTSFQDIIEKYKNDHTKIGIDISYWQGNIDFQELKKSHVEFAYLRVGRRDGVHGKIVEDKKFQEYITGFNKVKIPVGVYFYSKASNIEEVKEEVEWILKKIKKYQVDLEVVIDWENWEQYQDYHLSFYHLTEMAQVFLSEVEKKGYQSMLYSSKYYLENIWYPVQSHIWLAHYTEQTDYQKEYRVWQICNNGKVSGIHDNLVDIDIRYES